MMAIMSFGRVSLRPVLQHYVMTPRLLNLKTLQCLAKKQDSVFGQSCSAKATCFQGAMMFSSCSSLRSEGKENESKLEETAQEDRAISHRFIPMTRRTLCRQLLEDTNLYASSDHLKFQDLAVGVDTAISRGFYGTLGEIKALYDPMNPDKETMVGTNMSKNERLDNEFWLLQKLSKLLEKAHFYELSSEHVEAALAEHAVYEGVLVSVDTKKYDVIRFWVLGEENAPVEMPSAAEKLVYYSKVLMKKAPKEIPIYKRVVLVVRTKKQNKLMLKSFKDIPTNSLEYLLPEGKIRMSKNDKYFIASTVFVGLTTGMIKLISSLADYHVQWTYIAGIVTVLLMVRALNVYKNKRNSYLMNLSKLLYFKTVANNRALLALIVDRAQDESFKSALLTYSFLRASSRLVSEVGDPSALAYASGMTAEELKIAVENWMRTKYKFDVEYNAEKSLELLADLGLLSQTTKNGHEVFKVPSLDEALKTVPAPQMPAVPGRTEREEDLDFDQVSPDLQQSDESRMEGSGNMGEQITWK